jgi:hypothetical protein
MAVLIGTKRFASAAALARPALECLAAAAWILYCATPQRIETLFGEHDDVPTLGALATALHKVKRVSSLGLLELMEDKGRLFHKLAHASMHQVRRRYSEDQDASTYSAKEVEGLLLFADLFALVTAAVYAATAPNPKLEVLIKNSLDKLMGGLGPIFPGAEPWIGWEPLPATDAVLGRTAAEIRAAS